MSDDPNSGQATEREAYTPRSDSELHYLLRYVCTARSMWRDVLLELADQRRYRATLQKENAALQAEIRSLTNQELSPEYKEALDKYVRKPTDTEAFAERLAAVEDRLAANVGNTVAAHKRIDGAFRTLDRQHDRIAYAEDTLQHHASLIAGLGRHAVDTAVEDTSAPASAEAGELVLERGSIVRVRAGTKVGQVGQVVLSNTRDWEVVGVCSAADEPLTVQLGYLPWNSERTSGRPLYWVAAEAVEDIVGLVE